jgi:3-hydroxyisobutyrate dehydrogenase-like beta-hydroxyacid dehydrogenase
VGPMIETVALLSPGDMGHAIGRALRSGGLRVVTSLEGRSARTAALATAAGIEALPDDATLVREADALLAVLVPAAAPALGERIARALEETGATLLYADLNAIAPRTAHGIGVRLEGAGARFVDGGIIGGPPQPGRAGPRIYLSGAPAPELEVLGQHGLEVRVLGPEVGQASGLKMCYAAMTKGLTALATELLVAGEAMGLSAPLRAELEGQQSLWGWMQRSVPGMPPKAYRWVGEMEEIAATFAATGLTPRILEGAADMYRFVGETPLGQETPEARRQGTTLEEVVRILAQSLPPGEGPGGADSPSTGQGTERAASTLPAR